MIHTPISLALQKWSRKSRKFEASLDHMVWTVFLLCFYSLLCTCVCTSSCHCVWVPTARRVQIPWGWTHRWLRAAMWLLGVNHRISRRADSPCHSWAIAPDLEQETLNSVPLLTVFGGHGRFCLLSCSDAFTVFFSSIVQPCSWQATC